MNRSTSALRVFISAMSINVVKTNSFSDLPLFFSSSTMIALVKPPRADWHPSLPVSSGHTKTLRQVPSKPNRGVGLLHWFRFDHCPFCVHEFPLKSHRLFFSPHSYHHLDRLFSESDPISGRHPLGKGVELRLIPAKSRAQNNSAR